MANKRVEIMDLKQLLQLKSRGKSNRYIADVLCRSRNTINEYVQLFRQCPQSLEELSQLSLGDLYKLLIDLKGENAPEADSRYEELEKHKQVYLDDLKRPGATYQILWHQYKKSYPDGYGYTQFKHHLQHFQKQVDYSMPMQHKYGDKLFIDFTGKKLPIVDHSTGEVQPMEVFIGILGGSNYTYVQACSSQNLENFISCTVNCLEYFGGVPQALVPDNLKSAVTKASNYEAIINRQYKSLGTHYNTVVFPTRAGKPRDKALVEGAVKLVYQRIFFHLSKMTFFSLAELNEQIHILLEQYNDQPFYKQEESRKERFIKNEKELLRPLPPYAYEPKEVKRGKVQKNCHVFLKQHYYSVPHSYVGKTVKLHFNDISVEIYYNYERIAIHKRSEKPWGYTTIKTHMPSQHQFVMDWNPDRFIRWGKNIGSSTAAYIEQVLKRYSYPEQAYKSCLGILTLAKKYSVQRLEKACKRGLLYEKYSFSTIDRILTLKMDQIQEESEENKAGQLSIPLHDNIRGAAYFE